LDQSKYSQRQRSLSRWGALKNERTTWISRYQDVSKFLLPYSGRYFTSDRNKGDRSFNSILDSSATDALDILSAGMMAGMTSPARPWFRLALADTDLMEYDPVKLWLDDVSKLMRDVFAKSNTYRALHTMYEELGAFSTAVTLIDSDFDSVIWQSPLTAGEYAIGADAKGRVNTLYREYEMTVAQIVEEFGNLDPRTGAIDWSNISQSVKNLWDTGKGYDSWRPVLHTIEPRAFAVRGSGPTGRDMPWASRYYEMGADSDDKVLRESGYKETPFLAPRWHTRGGDIYGHGPAMKALGDIKQLQHQQLRKGQAIDYMSLPPIALPAEMKGSEVDTLPGGVSYLTAMAGSGRGHNLMDVRIDLSHLLVDIEDVRKRVNRAFYADLFLMISNDQRRMPVTAREIAERHEEKLLMLGPVLERLHDEMLSPLIDQTFFRMVEAGIIPQAPPELEGMDLKVEFVSTLAQAQKAVGLSSFDRLIATVAAVATHKQDPSVWDKLDTDQLIDRYSDMLAADPSVIVADEKIAVIRADRAKQQQAMQAAAAAPAAAGAMRDLSQVKTDEANAASDIMQQFQGYTTQ